jgi:DNA-binding MarR family transcriptional regulator
MDEEDIYRLRRSVKALSRRLERERPYADGLSATSLQILVVLERSPRLLRPGELAAELQMMDSNVSAALRTLEAERMIVLISDPDDGRKAFIELTSKARKTIAKLRHSYNAWLLDSIDRNLNAREQRLLAEASELMKRLVLIDGSANSIADPTPPVSRARPPAKTKPAAAKRPVTRRVRGSRT